MVAFNFKSRFACAVARGTKRQTIRAYRKDGRDPAPGCRLQLYSGMRTKHCRKLGDAVLASRERIVIADDGIKVGGRVLDARERHELAVADGFADWPGMRDFFAETHGLPFEGYLYRWRDFQAAE